MTYYPKAPHLYSQKAAATHMVYYMGMDNTWHYGMMIPTTFLLGPFLVCVAHSFRYSPSVMIQRSTANTKASVCFHKSTTLPVQYYNPDWAMPLWTWKTSAVKQIALPVTRDGLWVSWPSHPCGLSLRLQAKKALGSTTQF